MTATRNGELMPSVPALLLDPPLGERSAGGSENSREDSATSGKAAAPAKAPMPARNSRRGLRANIESPFCILYGDKIPQAVVYGQHSQKKIWRLDTGAGCGFATMPIRPYDFSEAGLRVLQRAARGLDGRGIHTKSKAHKPLDHRYRGHAQYFYGSAGHYRSERFAAAHRRQPLRNGRRSYLDADFLSRRQRHHIAADRLAFQFFWPQADADVLRNRLYDRVLLVRPRSQPSVPRCVP